MNNILGHIKQKKYFKILAAQGKLEHAYLFTGPAMIGKKTFAIDLYEILNKKEYKIGDPDVLMIGPESSAIAIDSIRQVKSFMSLRPYLGPYKLIIIDDAHLMTNEAANALLKALEEPTSSSILILISSQSASLPKTIYSRCQEVKFQPLNENEILDLLSEAKLSKEDKDFILKISLGRPGLAKFLIEKENLKIAKEAVDDLRGVIKKSLADKMLYAQKIAAKEDYHQKIDYWLGWVYANLQKSPNNWKMVKGLINLNNITSQPGLNHRLALENFFINLTN